MAGKMKSSNPKATVAMKATGKQGGTNGVAKKQTDIKAKSSGGVNTPPKAAVPKAMYGKTMMKSGGTMTKAMYGQSMMKKGGMVKSKSKK